MPPENPDLGGRTRMTPEMFGETGRGMPGPNANVPQGSTPPGIMPWAPPEGGMPPPPNSMPGLQPQNAPGGIKPEELPPLSPQMLEMLKKRMLGPGGPPRPIGPSGAPAERQA
jgi:hypothetical protein